MGNVSRVLITGAGGFIGQATVTAAKEAGLGVVASGRAQIDLGARDATAKLQDAMVQCDAVIHLAAAMGGSAAEHDRVTINGTRAVLTAMQGADVRKLVLVSSMSVYRLEALAPGEMLSSASEVDTPETARDTYARAKCEQEALAQKAGIASLTILRPGIVYSDTRLWNAHLGIGVGPVLFSFPKHTALPMCSVTHLAQTIIDEAQHPSGGAHLVVDPELPSRGIVIDQLRQTGWPKLVLPFPWGALRLAASAVSPIDKKLPGLLRSRVLEQRMYPMGRVDAGALTWHPSESQ